MLAGERSVAKGLHQGSSSLQMRETSDLETPSRPKAFINSSTFPRRHAVDVRLLNHGQLVPSRMGQL